MIAMIFGCKSDLCFIERNDARM